MEQTYEPPVVQPVGDFAAHTLGRPYGELPEFVTGWVRIHHR